MNLDNNPFEVLTGSNRIVSKHFLLALGFIVIFAAILTAKMGFIGGGVLLIMPFAFCYLYLLFQKPIIGLYTAVFLGFVLLGIGRYIKGIPIGLAMDGTLILTYIAIFFNKFHEKMDWSPAKKDVTLLAAIWFGYSILQIVNPEARSFAAWFSGRGLGLYMFLMIPLTLLYIDNDRKLNIFFYIWAFCSILVTLKGIMQLKLGVDPWEQAWLDEGSYKTHILFGKLRVFSFLSDAGQFGANQAYTGVVLMIASMGFKKWPEKLFFLSVSLLAFYGMVISGTRGAISIPLGGIMAYVVLRKNIKIMILGFLMLVGIFIFFKYTNIGQGNAQIRRMRTAFDPNDASLQVRLANQNKLKSYMASRPFGGGIGHGGTKAQRFLPNAYLSQVPTDSGYVLIWVEEGVVGLVLFLGIFFYILARSSLRIMFVIKNPIVKYKMSALVAGMSGIIVANYGNAVLAQMPTSMLIFTSMGLLMNMEIFDDPKPIKQINKE